jgi:nocardicin N-oxygenase
VDPPAHTRWRKLVAAAFTPRQVDSMRAGVQQTVDGLLDRMATKDPPVDLVREFAYPLCIAVICELLGIDVEEHARFGDLAEVALTITGATEEEKGAAFGAMAAFSSALIATKRGRAGTDFLSKLIAVHDEQDGRLSEDELVATILALMIGGYESTVNQLGKAVLALFRYPEQLAALRADPALIGSAVEESLRYAALDSGFGSPRYATADLPIGDVVIPKGSTVLVIRQSANRDEEQFADPECFDIGRTPNQHLSFGYGPHRCLGAALARVELNLGIGTLIRRFPGLRLTVGVDDIRWDYRITVAGPATLPVAW